jgi:hypothetical protein
MECFAKTPGALPPPSTTVHSVWNLVPNDRVDTMSMPQQADVTFIRAPPTTTFTNADDPSSLTYETRTPTSHTRRADNIFVTQPGEPPIVAGLFQTNVDAKIEELRAHGMAFVVKSLLADGVQGVQSTPFVSMVARTMLNRLAMVSLTKMELFKTTLRAGAMEDFLSHWKSVESFSAN